MLILDLQDSGAGDRSYQTAWKEADEGARRSDAELAALAWYQVGACCPSGNVVVIALSIVDLAVVISQYRLVSGRAHAQVLLE